MKRCMWCESAPAEVFTPDVALCRPCRRELERQESEDAKQIDNAPTCPTCGGITERNEFCGWCDHQRVRAENEWKLAHA